MGIFDAFKGNKSWTGVVVDKKIRKITDNEGDEVARYGVIVEVDGDTPRQRTIDVNRDVFDKVEVGNRVVKEPNKIPKIHLGG